MLRGAGGARSGDPAALRDELGDVLLQVVFHARVAAERTDGTGFTIDDVADGIVDKLVRRHPHVFGDVKVSGAEEVKRNWDAIKAAERAAAGGRAAPGAGRGAVRPARPVAGRPAAAPGRAGRCPGRARRPAATGPALAGPGGDGQAPDGVSEIGAALFALVAQARAAGA